MFCKSFLALLMVELTLAAVLNKAILWICSIYVLDGQIRLQMNCGKVFSNIFGVSRTF